MFSVEVLETVTDLVKLMPDWQRLFEDPRRACRRVRRSGASSGGSITAVTPLMARDDLRVYVLRDDVGSLRAVAPMMITARPEPVRSNRVKCSSSAPTPMFRNCVEFARGPKIWITLSERSVRR